MKPNYNFFLSLFGNAEPAHTISQVKPKILDFGCGVGEIVLAGLDMSLDIYGADTFDGYYIDWKDNIPKEILGRISKINNNIIDYDDNTFDFVISNQVFEHIEEPLGSYMEISRVLKPGGVMYAIFPNKSVWYEGHVGLYFPHWFKRHSYAQRKYLEISYLLGLGRKRHLKPDGWIHILNDVTFHHPRKLIKTEIVNAFGNTPDDISLKFMAYRISNSKFKKIQPLIPKLAMLFFARIRAGSVFKVINK